MSFPKEQMSNVTKHLHGETPEREWPIRFIPKHLRVPVVYECETICTSPKDGFGRVEILDEWLQRFIGKRVKITVESIEE